MKMRSFVARLGVAGIVSLVPAAASHAVITHPSDDPIINSIAKPAADVVGRWDVDGAADASLVAIDPNHAITTRHQGGGGIGSIVEFGGTRYKISNEQPIGNVDLRVLTLTQEFSNAAANLSAFTPVYTALTAPLTQTVTLGGFGRPRGASLLDPSSQPYGYLWNTDVNNDSQPDTVNNEPESFGRNIVDATQAGVSLSGFVSNVIIADFDPASLTGPGGAVPGEADIAEFDSGGGWFVQVSPGVWQVAGLTEGLQHEGANSAQPGGRDLFAAFNNATIPSQDLLFGVDLTSYSGQIAALVPEPGSASLVLGAGAMVSLRRRRR